MNKPPERPWEHGPNPPAHLHAKPGPGGLLLAAADEVRSAGPLRLALGAVGIVGIAFGVVRILTSADATKPLQLIKWLIAAVILHDAILAPATVVVSWAVARVVKGRAQAYVLAGLAVAALTTLVAMPLLYRHGKSAPGTTLLTRNYAVNLLVLLAVIAVGSAIAYLVLGRRARTAPAALAAPPATAGAPSSMNDRVPRDH